MKANFKPLGLAAAVAAASTGAYADGHTSLNAEEQLGDLAIVPYYTTLGGYSTGINVINTSKQTQVVKIRFRRAEDSMDSMDFNVVLSPEDMYTGFISQEGEEILFTSNDNSCVVPDYDYSDNQFKMPSGYKEGAETGYIEIISMGSPADESTSYIAASALHDSTGVPANCVYVNDNFYPDGVAVTSTTGTRGVVSSVQSVQRWDDPVSKKTILVNNDYVASPDSLKVSYFIKSDETGVEFGNNAVHIGAFMDGASITNQRRGVFDGDLQGYDHPDLHGGAPASEGIANAASRGLYNNLRGILGADSLVNDWSQNDTGDFTVDTDWVVTIPGQYVMLDLPMYLFDLATSGLIDCAAAYKGPLPGEELPQAWDCDHRDIPMTATFKVIDREERGIIVEEGDLVVSPQPPVPEPKDLLDKEVNVIQWGQAPVLNADEFLTVPKPDGAKFGWANLSATSSLSKTQHICEYLQGTENPFFDAVLGIPNVPLMDCTIEATGSAPLIGFVAWQRNFDALPAANYGRIVTHSRIKSDS